ncbi:MAG: hypothetical protein ACYS0E_02065 [Planctomycetota bacterium]|jgi:hypothetical protein
MTMIAILLLTLAADKTVDLPVRHLKFKKGVSFSEGTRGMRDAFPYLRVNGPARTQLTPKSLPSLLDGEIESKEAAYEAVRLFVAGVPVEDGKLLIAEGEKLSKELKLLRVKLAAAPKSWKRVVEKQLGGWTVRFVAFEMDNVLQLVRIDAAVTTHGDLRIRRVPIIEGPVTVWQSMVINGESDGGEEKMRAEAKLARVRYAKALQPPRDLDTAFAIARLRLTPAQISDLWPGKRRSLGSGLRIVGVDLKGGTCAIYDATVPDRPISSLLHNKDARSPMRRGTTLHRLAALR